MNILTVIPPAILLILSLLACLGGNWLKNYYSKRIANPLQGYCLYSGVVSLTAALITLIFFDSFSFSPFTLLLGIVFGAVTVLQSLTHLEALKLGPFSYTSVITSLSSIIPALSGFLFWGEPFAWNHALGLVFMAICFIFSVAKDSKAFSLKWLLFCSLAALSTGAIGVLQKIHQSSKHSGELMNFLFSAFLIASLFSFIVYAVLRMKNKNANKKEEPLDGEALLADKKSTKKTNLLFFGLFVASGIFVSLNNIFNLYLSGVMESAVFFPVVNGGGLLLATLVSILFLKERLTKRQWLGFAAGIVAVILLCF